MGSGEVGPLSRLVEVRKLADDFVAALRVQGYATRTCNEYAHHLNLFVSHLAEEDADAFAVDYACLLRFMQKVRLGGVIEATMSKYKACLSSWYKWLIRLGKVHRNPVEMLPAIKVQEVDPTPLAVEDTLKILDGVRNLTWRNLERNKAILEMFYASGIRLNELRMLDVSDLALEGAGPHCKIRHGKGNKQGIGRLTPEAVAAIRAWLPKRAKILRRWERPNEPALFVSRIGERLGEWRIWDMVVDAGNKILGRRVHPHQFRHSFCTDLLNNGADLESIRKLARHKNLNTTQKYLNVSTAHLDEAYSKLPRSPQKD